jgi:hypothetical protein
VQPFLSLNVYNINDYRRQGVTIISLDLRLSEGDNVGRLWMIKK